MEKALSHTHEDRQYYGTESPSAFVLEDVASIINALVMGP